MRSRTYLRRGFTDKKSSRFTHFPSFSAFVGLFWCSQMVRARACKTPLLSPYRAGVPCITSLAKNNAGWIRARTESSRNYIVFDEVRTNTLVMELGSELKPVGCNATSLL